MWAFSAIEFAFKLHGLNSALLAGGLRKSGRERIGPVVGGIRELRREQSNRHGHGRFDLDPSLLAIVGGSDYAVELGGRGKLVFFFNDAYPFVFGLNAVLDTVPIVVGDEDVVGRNQLPSAGFADDGSDALEDGVIGSALVVKDEDHRSAGGEMAFVSGIDDMLA